MHVLVTGADGFVGRALVARLLQERQINSTPLSLLTAIDVGLDAHVETEGLRRLSGSIANPAFIATAFDRPVDVVFHLASIPGGTAEQNYVLSRDVNLGGTTVLLEACKTQAEVGDKVPRFVFASTIGVFSSPFPPVVTDSFELNPQTTYGAQKLIGETLVADFSRRRWLDGCSLRLSGVLARPPAKTGQLSAFLSDMIRELGAGAEFTCPTSPAATTWAASIHNIVDNLTHAAVVDSSRLPSRRALTLPALQFSMKELVSAIASVHGRHIAARVRWAPDARIESLFGRFPPLVTPAADAAGFSRDHDLPTLVRRAV
jgi:D-erythronate 2-dehydrogenase